jgi:hypothetical protein
MPKNKAICIICFLAASLIAVSTAICNDIELQCAGYLPLKIDDNAPVSKFLIKYDFPSYLDSVRIDQAILSIEVNIDTTADLPSNATAYMVSEPWVSSDVPSIDRYNIAINDSMGAFTFVRPPKTKISFDITQMIMGWVAGNYSNNGLAISLFPEDYHLFELPAANDGSAAKLRIYFTKMEPEQ